MIPYIISPRALEIAALYWSRPWWELTQEEIELALRWWNGRSHE